MYWFTGCKDRPRLCKDSEEVRCEEAQVLYVEPPQVSSNGYRKGNHWRNESLVPIFLVRMI